MAALGDKRDTAPRYRVYEAPALSLGGLRSRVWLTGLPDFFREETNMVGVWLRLLGLGRLWASMRAGVSGDAQAFVVKTDGHVFDVSVVATLRSARQQV